MKFVRTLFLFVCGLGLLSLGGFVLGGSVLAMPAAVAGVSTLAIALA